MNPSAAGVGPGPEDLVAAARTLTRVGRLLERSCGAVSLAQYRVLRSVADGGDRASRLADLLTLARPTITEIVNGLVERGLLRRCEVASDRRACRLVLTPAGEQAIGAAEESMADRLGKVIATMDPPAPLIEALARFDLSLDHYFGVAHQARPK
ncbi:MAG: MarR family winged helix-turn-helix transcriptional regulator [Acidimicrobiales bacterium]